MLPPTQLSLGQQDLPSLRATLRRAGVRHNDYASALFRQVNVGPPAEVRVVVRTVAELGFSDGAELGQVMRALPAQQLAPCPLEVALLLRLAWRDRTIFPRVTVLSPRPTPAEDAPRGWYLRDDAEGCWLRAYVASEDWRAPPEERLAVLWEAP
jgi:hypothetical protein